jgi:hypothetical protein
MNHYLKAVSVLILLVFGAAASESAMAQHHGGVRFGVNIGIPLFGPGYYPPYAYPAPAYAYPAPAYAYPAPAYSYPAPAYSYPGPAVAPSAAYAQQGYSQAAPAPAQPQDWYYCTDSKAYYPYVRDCPTGWQRVPAQPQPR